MSSSYNSAPLVVKGKKRCCFSFLNQPHIQTVKPEHKDYIWPVGFSTLGSTCSKVIVLSHMKLQGENNDIINCYSWGAFVESIPQTQSGQRERSTQKHAPVSVLNSSWGSYRGQGFKKFQKRKNVNAYSYNCLSLFKEKPKSNTAAQRLPHLLLLHGLAERQICWLGDGSSQEKW